jgi:virulence factor Mce-like protein
MRRRSGFQTVAGNPTLVGAVTVLIVIVAVFLAYNANTGLPFVPTYKITAQVPDGNALVDYNEVRVGGNRVGVVEKVRPYRLENGEVGARLDMKLDQRVKPVPVDSTLVIRTKSTLGLKYVELNLGDSDEGFAEGAVMPLSAATPEPVDLDDFFSMFDEKTRKSMNVNLAEFGAAFAGRGTQLNAAFGELPSLLRYAYPVTKLIADPKTDFRGFWRAMADTAAEVAPVAEQQASMFVNLDITFAAFARVARPYIQETIIKSPPTLDTVNRTLPEQRPFLRNSAEFFEELQPGAKALAKYSPVLARTLKIGIPVLRSTPRLNRQLPGFAQSLVDFQESPGAMDGLRLVTKFNNLLRPGIHFIAPAQTTCNYLTLAIRNVASLASRHDGAGHGWFTILAFTPPGDGLRPPERPTNVISGQASAPAAGPISSNFLNYNPYPNTAAPGQPFECEAGNERFRAGRLVIGNSPGTQSTTTDAQYRGQAKLPRIKRPGENVKSGGES